MRSIFSFLFLAVTFLTSSAALAEYGQYPGATWERHTRDRAGSFDHNRQCDENGCLITNTTRQSYQAVDQYYVPHNRAQNYYQPQPTYTAPRNYYRNSSGTLTTYYDNNGNVISYERYTQMRNARIQWANQYGSRKDQRDARAIPVD